MPVFLLLQALGLEDSHIPTFLLLLYVDTSKALSVSQLRPNIEDVKRRFLATTLRTGRLLKKSHPSIQARGTHRNTVGAKS